MKIIIPLYDLSYYSTVLRVCQRYGARCVIVLNINSGPGARKDETWESRIKSLAATGCKLIGYIDAMKWPDDGRVKVAAPRIATSSEMLSERKDWITWYNVQFFFYDDIIKDTGIPSCAAKGDFLNFGTKPFANVPAGMIAVVWEKANYAGKKVEIISGDTAVFALNVKDYGATVEVAKKENIKFLFCTDRNDKKPDGTDDWTTYNDLPSWFEDFCKKVPV